MRWKLLIAASLLAAVAGAGAALAVAYFASGATTATGSAMPTWLIAAAFLFPLAATASASVFVYRHTARRRTLQAAATALLSVAITLAALLFVPRLFAPRPTPPTDARPAGNVGQLKKR